MAIQTDTIMGDTPNYDDGAQWEAGTDIDLGGDEFQGLCRPGTDTSAITIAGATNGTRTLTAETPITSGRVAGVAGGTILKRGASGHTILVQEDGFLVSDLEIEMDVVNQGASDEGIRNDITAGAQTCTIKRMLIHGGTTSQMDGVYSARAGHLTNIENTIIYNFQRGGVHQQVDSGTPQFICINVAAYDCGTNTDDPESVEQGNFITRQSGSSTATIFMTCINCVAGMRGGAGMDFNRWASGGGTLQDGSAYRGHNNTSSDGTAAVVGDGFGQFTIGSADLVDDTVFADTTGASAVIFDDLTLDSEDFHLTDHANNVAKETGSTESGTFLDDFEGTVRTVTWDRGAHEVSVGGATSILVPSPLYRGIIQQ